MFVKPGMQAPSFETFCFIDGEIHNISLNDYRGEWLILFFYPHDFENLSSADLLSLNEHYNMLSKKNCRFLPSPPTAVSLRKGFLASVLLRVEFVVSSFRWLRTQTVKSAKHTQF